jgi:hypothetical protein
LIVSVCVVFGGTATHNELVLFLIYIKVIIKIWKDEKKFQNEGSDVGDIFMGS